MIELMLNDWLFPKEAYNVYVCMYVCIIIVQVRSVRLFIFLYYWPYCLI